MPSTFDTFDHQGAIGRLCRVIATGTQEAALRQVNAAGYTDLRAPHLLVLFVLSSGAQRPAEVARGARMSRQAFAYCLRQLEAGGYVARSARAAGDGVRVVAITERGIEAAEVAIKVGYAIEDRLRRTVGQLNFDEFVSTLELLAEGLYDDRGSAREVPADATRQPVRRVGVG